MDIQPSQSNKIDDKEKVPLANGQNENSRFSRRRFIQSGIAVSPLLMSVKSPVAWGCTNTNNSSVTSRISGNASTTASSGCIPRNPRDWCKVFKNEDNQYDDFWDQFKHRGEASSSSLKSALSFCGIRYSTSFLDLFCNELSNWSSCRTKSNWGYKILTNHCDNPSVYDALQTDSLNLLLRVQRGDSDRKSDSYYSSQNNNIFNAMGYSITSSNNDKCFDVSISDLNLHKYLTCGYLNGVLAPNVVAYQYTQTDILNGFIMAISKMADEIAQYGKHYQPSLGSPCSTLRDNLRKTWDDDDSCYT